MTIPATPETDLAQLRARVQTLEHERRQLLAIVEILQEIGGSLEFTDIVQAVARRLGEALGLDRCSVYLAEKGGRTARLVASMEDPTIRNHVVDLERYPEIRRALDTAQTVIIPDAAADPALQHVQAQMRSRKVKSITVVPMRWQGAPIGVIFLRTFRDGPGFSEQDVRFTEVVAGLTAKALANAHRYESLFRGGGAPGDRSRQDRERAVLVGFLRRLLEQFAGRDAGAEGLARASQEELERLVGVTLTVLTREAEGQ
ncbi:MAG TPA: GAF domain-containing protein [Gemmatimonadales bacterium]|jgi:GAF domain-containing protein|nr:GAF domain-containing protein [Gemmatimonadales bacterium]